MAKRTGVNPFATQLCAACAHQTCALLGSCVRIDPVVVHCKKHAKPVKLYFGPTIAAMQEACKACEALEYGLKKFGGELPEEIYIDKDDLDFICTCRFFTDQAMRNLDDYGVVTRDCE